MIANTINTHHLLLIIPRELLLLILQFLGISSIFSLSLTSKMYRLNNIIKPFMVKQPHIHTIRLNAIGQGYIDLVKWLLHNQNINNIKPFFEAEKNSQFTIEAAKNGQLEVLKWLRSDDNNKCLWTRRTCSAAAENGHLEILKWLRFRSDDNDNDNDVCPWDSCSCEDAAMNGHLEILKWLRSDIHKNKCPWGETTCYYACYYACANIDEPERLDIVKYLHENNCGWCKYSCGVAVEYGHLELLKYLHDNGCPWDEHTCRVAAERGDLEILRYLHENECPWNELTCQVASENGHLELLKYLHENGHNK